MSAYLDNAASTPVRPETLAAMVPWLTDGFGNPSGMHGVARAARQAIDEARDVVAECVGAEPGEVVFTSGGTEADNLALRGVTGVRAGSVVAGAGEHPAVKETVEALGGRLVPFGADGTVDLAALDAAIDEHTVLVSVMTANNETGAITDLAEVQRVMRAHDRSIKLHSDAVQAAPWLDLIDSTRKADLISISAHKFGGPKGVGALIVRKGTKIVPQLTGGGQEQERRSGTQNVAGIVGMATALRITVEQRVQTNERIEQLRNRFIDEVCAALPTTRITAANATKTPGIAHLTFPGIEAESLLVMLDEAGVSASAGSSCASGAFEPSHVLMAMGFSEIDAKASVRFSLGWATTDTDIDFAVKVIPDVVARLGVTV